MEYIGDCYSLDCTIVIHQIRHVQMAVWNSIFIFRMRR